MHFQIQAQNFTLTDGFRHYAAWRVAHDLNHGKGIVSRVVVQLGDVNGPRGGVDKRCEIKVVLSGLPSVVVTERHQSLQAAMDGAIDRITRTVRRALERRKTRATRGRGAAVAAAGG